MSSPRSVHLVGIGGAGMSALARLAVSAGYSVSGTDREDSEVLAALRAMGVDARAGHAAEALPPAAEAVVVSTAVGEGTPDLVAARERGLDVMHRSEFLAELMELRRGVAVAGAHGKSTTSGMLACAMAEASACVGAVIEGGDGTGARWGGGEWFVAEADESDRSLLNLAPEAAILLNVDHDHHATYATIDDVRAVFRAFVARLPADGLLVVGPDEEARRCAEGAPCRVVHVGDIDGSACRIERAAGRPGFTAVLADGRRVEVPLGVPGLHNAGNAACALVLAEWCGVPAETSAGRLAGFRGVGRRMEERGRVAGIRVVDDYAHHPAEITATLAAAREDAPERIIVIYQPHLPSRTRALAPEIGAALAGADIAIVTEVYLAREPADPVVGGAQVAAAVPPAATEAHFAPDLAAARDIALAEARPGDLVMTMGAGDVTTLGQELMVGLANLYPDGDTSART
ncbi:MAG: UDP-N-acetylmuramate--L-alanine ligase [Miltoncostaeaceae bacterium]